MTHTCHVEGCKTEVPEKLLMCGRHWKMCPPFRRSAVWAAYRPGQEIEKNPSRDYIAAARAACESVKAKEDAERAQPDLF